MGGLLNEGIGLIMREMDGGHFDKGTTVRDG